MDLAEILFGFDGRIRRTTYWLGHIGATMAFLVIFVVLASVAGGVATATGHAGARGGGALGGLMLLLLLPLFAASMWVAFALGVKRCHDRGYPGAMILITFVPFIGGLWALVDLGFIDGTPGPNDYGPSPKYQMQTSVSSVFS